MVAEYSLDDLLYLMSRLRDPVDGCPWDIKQQFDTIIPHTIEEAYELADAIAEDDKSHIKEELGDVLFQVIFYAQMGKEEGSFDFPSIVSHLVEKLVRRHPHVFPGGDLQARFGEQPENIPSIKQNWEAIKAKERQGKQQTSVLDDVPVALPAMTRSIKLQKRAANVGFDWPDLSGVMSKLREELDELEEAREQQDEQAIAAEFGDVLFCLGNLARHLRIEPESALRGSNSRFEERFRYIEERLSAQGKHPEEASLAEMDALWDEAKKTGL